MKKTIFVLSLIFTGLMTSCVDKNEEVPADEKPSWLGASIYQELKNPNQEALTGTFNTYLRLVDDLDYAEILDRTGSKTVFPANDEAFDRFFSKNDWGVSSYEQLTESQKKLLLYSSMLDNALLIGMLPNVSANGNNVMKGMAIKHATAVSVTDSIELITSREQMPAYNKFWDKYHDRQIHVVRDNTTPMMVHLTRDYMLNNNITTKGPESDFAIITGTEYTDGMAYIFNNKVITKHVNGLTCQNGYVHQLDNVLVPPGNMVDVLKKDSDTKLFSRILDYFSAPFFDKATTDNYNSWALVHNQPTIDSIYQVRYFSTRSQGSQLALSPEQTYVGNVLKFDPGWNSYEPEVSNNVSYDPALIDLAALLVPDDKAIKEYFLPGGIGEYLIDIYGATGKPNDEEHLGENLDSLFKKNAMVLTDFVKNLQQEKFTATVPSKFYLVTNDASENMGLTVDYLKRTEDGKYDIKFANNGVVYVINKMIAPDKYQSVMAPAATYPDMSVMRWMLEDKDILGVDYQYYLLAMSANYAFFIPDNAAFADKYYINPGTLPRYPNMTAEGDGDDPNVNRQPEVFKFVKDGDFIRYERYKYDPVTQEIGDLISGETVKDAAAGAYVKSVLVDILNYHTIVLADGEKLGKNKYYKTKHGAEIMIDGAEIGNKVVSGAQIDNGVEPSEVLNVYNEKNGVAYRINHVIEAPQNSVYKTLVKAEDNRFSEFIKLCDMLGAGNSQILDWAGISSVKPENSTKSPQDRLAIFTSSNGDFGCLDQNVNFFNTYNYTLYAPNNEAVEQAYANGLPKQEDIEALFLQFNDENGEGESSDEVSAEEQAAKNTAYAMLMAVRKFIRYHFQTVSVYADNVLDFDGTKAQTMSSDDLGVALETEISGGAGKIVIIDASKKQHVVDVNDQTKVVNKMTRDYWFDGTKINTSSFCAIHEITEPFNYNEDGGRYDSEFSSAKNANSAAKRYKKLFDENKL